MLNVYDLNLKRTAVLQNAFDITETTELNTVYQLTFSLPNTDPKCAYCKKRHYVRYDDGELYRILDRTLKDTEKGTITYECEHASAKLVDKTMFGTYTIGGRGIYTRDILEYLLNFQKSKDWTLDRCAFSRQFEYSWSHSGLYDAIMSVPNRFTEPYIWRYDTSSYPWKLSLDAIDITEKPQFYIRANKNLLTMEKEDPSSSLYTVIYPLGYGEGDNQLTIKDVNNGVPYLKSPQSIIDEYGEIEVIWADKRFENAQSLKERAEALLAAYQEPRLSITLSAADLYELTNDDIDKAEVGRIVMLTEDNYKTYITKVVRHLDQDGVMEITISNKPSDISDTITDLANRQRISEVYSQGATQLYAQSIQANATTEKGAILRFNVPSEMRIVNAVSAKITLNQFRSYSKATAGGGGETVTTSDGGGTTSTSSDGGGGTYGTTSGSGGSASTSTGGGGSATTSTSNRSETSSYSIASQTGSTNSYTHASTGKTNSHSHDYLQPTSHSHTFNFGHSHYLFHSHEITIPSHSHTVNIGSHSHSVSLSIPAHSHSVNIPSHSHTVKLEAHTHDITQGIFEFGNATGANIYVNGKLKGTMTKDAEIELTPYLLNDSNEIPRDTWIEVEIRPNDLAYVTIDMFVKGYIQSRGGGTY